MSDIRQSFMNQTVDEDFLNNEWERVLQEADKVKLFSINYIANIIEQ